MIKKIIKILFILVIIIILGAIDIPHGQRIAFKTPWFDLDQTLKPLTLQASILKKPFVKTFETKLGLDLRGGSRLVFEADISKTKPADIDDAIEGARNVIEQRINFFGVSEPTVKTIISGGTYQIAVELPGVDDVASAVSLIGQTAQLEFKEYPTKDYKVATDTPMYMQLTKKTGLTGAEVKKARVEFDSQNGNPVVGLEFSDKGSRLFEEVTERNVGKPLGIFLDNMPITYPPTVQQKITGGKAQISGQFTIDQAKELAIAINSGALPISVSLVEQKTIGPTLGAQQIKQSMIAGVIGLLSVFLFMILYYGRLGIIASIGLIIYGAIVYAIMRSIPIVLTLPGIAGFLLSIGMAVDANILIFERIKEELRKGHDTIYSINHGFGRAIDAIKDANVTTLLVAFILFNPLNWDFLPQFGLVKGFALTLALGVVVSLFTGVFITKRLINMFYK